jgi:hypothetical protein
MNHLTTILDALEYLPSFSELASIVTGEVTYGKASDAAFAFTYDSPEAGYSIGLSGADYYDVKALWCSLLANLPQEDMDMLIASFKAPSDAAASSSTAI